jgi:hypothetical protein
LDLFPNSGHNESGRNLTNQENINYPNPKANANPHYSPPIGGCVATLNTSPVKRIIITYAIQIMNQTITYI